LLEVAAVDDCEPNPRPGETAVGFLLGGVGLLVGFLALILSLVGFLNGKRRRRWEGFF
jgi:hypothetical protein